MPKVKASELQRIKDTLSLETIAAPYVDLKRVGNNLRGCCPFHDETTPSFTIYLEENRYYCYGCKAHGNVIDFVMGVNNTDFKGALDYLEGYERLDKEEIYRPAPAKRVAPQPLKQPTDEWSKDLFKIARYFHSKLNDKALAYLEKRGIKKPVIKAELVGYAPDDWNYAINELSNQVGMTTLHELGFINPRKNGQGYYSVFRNRIILPCKNRAGYIVGFNSRALDNQPAKYLLSKNTDYFRKKESLYGIHLLRKDEPIWLVEGNFDVLSLVQQHNAVCPQGSQMTPKQVESIIQLNPAPLILAFDNDEAGISIGDKIKAYVKQKHPHVEIMEVHYPNGIKDISELIERHLNPQNFVFAEEQKASDSEKILLSTAYHKRQLAIPIRDRIFKQQLPITKKGLSLLNKIADGDKLLWHPQANPLATIQAVDDMIICWLIGDNNTKIDKIVARINAGSQDKALFQELQERQEYGIFLVGQRNQLVA